MAKLPPLNDEDRENLVAYLDGELDAQAARGLEARLNLDAEARAEAEALRRTWEMLDYLPRPEPTATFSSRTLQRVAAPEKLATKSSRRAWRPWALRAGWAAALLVAGTLGFAGVSWFSARKPTPAEPAPRIDVDPVLARDLRLLENQRLYELVGDIRFLRELDDPELFGDDG